MAMSGISIQDGGIVTEGDTESTRTRSYQSRRRLSWRLVAYPLIYWRHSGGHAQQPATLVVDSAIWQEPLIELAARQRGRGLNLPRLDTDLPAGHLALLWWDGDAALAFAPQNESLPCQPSVLKRQDAGKASCDRLIYPI